MPNINDLYFIFFWVYLSRKNCVCFFCIEVYYKLFLLFTNLSLKQLDKTFSVQMGTSTSKKLKGSGLMYQENRLYGVGYNHFKELGSKYETPIRELISIDNINDKFDNNLKHITPGSNHNIYSDSNHKNIYFMGIENDQIIKISHFMIKIVTICQSWIDHKPFNTAKIFFISTKQQPYFIDIGRDETVSMKKINGLKHVLNITSTDDTHYALCEYSYNVTSIANEWYGNILPTDIMNLIILYHSTNQIFHQNVDCNDIKTWTKIDELDNKHITKIVATKKECFFIDASSSLWRGLGFQKYGYFDRNRIKIKDIKCGFYHCLCIDFDGNIYSFGRNWDGQCGHGLNKDYVDEPRLIQGLKMYNIVRVKCGAYHSYAMSDNGKHFMFGDNYYYQCLIFEGNKKRIKEPVCVNDVFDKLTKGIKIRDIFLGNGNTMIVT